MSQTLYDNIPPSRVYFTDANGKPLAGGMVWTYLPNTTTPEETWGDPFGVSPNANPLTLDAAGSWPIFGTGTYRFIVKDQFGNLISDGPTVAGPGAGAGGILYTAGFIGAVQETLQEKLDQLVSIVDFGAIPGEDCSEAFDAALTAVGYAFVPPGTWTVNATVFPPNNSSIFGVAKKSIITSPLNVTAIFSLAAANNVAFEDLTIIGTEAACVALYCQGSSVQIQNVLFLGCWCTLNECFACLLDGIIMAPSQTQPAGLLTIEDTTVTSAGCKDGVITNFTYLASFEGATGIAGVYCVKFSGATRWNCSNWTINTFYVVNTEDLIQITGPCVALNFSGLALTGGANGINIFASEGNPAVVGGPPTQINIEASNIQGCSNAGINLLGASDGMGGSNEPVRINIIGNLLGVATSASGIVLNTVQNISIRGNKFFPGPSSGAPGIPPDGVAIISANYSDISDNSMDEMHYGVVASGSVAGNFNAITNNRIVNSSVADIFGVPGAVVTSGTGEFADPYGWVVRDNNTGNPPPSFVQPAAPVYGTPVLNDSGFDCQVVINSASGRVIKLGGQSFTPGGDVVLDVQTGQQLEVVSGTAGATWFWLPK